MASRMNRLRQKVSPDCPVIFTGNWPAELNKGWRWVCNLSLTDDTSEEILDDYQTAHGKNAVTVGHPFDENDMKPKPIDKLCGLYVRDVEMHVRELRRELNDDKKVEEWLTA